MTFRLSQFSCFGLFWFACVSWPDPAASTTPVIAAQATRPCPVRSGVFHEYMWLMLHLGRPEGSRYSAGKVGPTCMDDSME